MVRPAVVSLVSVAFTLTVIGEIEPQRSLGAAEQSRPSADTGAAKAVAAANAFLESLDAPLKSKAQLELRPDLRARWSNLPTGVVMQADRARGGGPYERNGVAFGELTKVQQEAGLALVAASLSPRGYRKVLDIVNADQILEQTVGPTRPKDNRVRFGRAEYHLALLGAPSATEPWMIQFGGHHLAINVSVVGRNSVLTPSHTGTQPTTYTLEERTVRPLGAEEDKAFALVNALSPQQRSSALLSYKVADLVVGPGDDGKVIQPEGVRASAFSRDQQNSLVDLVAEWVNILNDAEASARLADVRKNLPETYFAWSGPLTREGGAYYRIQGPTVLIEYAPQATRGADGRPDHIHTLYRDPTNDYAARLVRR